MYSGLLVTMLLLALTPGISAAQETEWLVAPYIWLPSVKLDQSSGGGGSADADQLLDKTDGAGMLRVEAARNDWGFTLDYLFISLRDDTVVSLPPPRPPGDVNVRADIDAAVLELGGFYRPSGTDTGVNFLFGVRRIEVEKGLLLTLGPGGANESFTSDSSDTDIFVGARYLLPFSDRWIGAVRGDLSSGDTEGTLNLLASLGYRFTGGFTLQFGYRHFALELKNNVNGVTEISDLEFSGPFVGFVFGF